MGWLEPTLRAHLTACWLDTSAERTPRVIKLLSFHFRHVIPINAVAQDRIRGE